MQNLTFKDDTLIVNALDHEITEPVYVYCAFLPPGKHNILIKDHQTDELFYKHFLVEPRYHSIPAAFKRRQLYTN